MEDIQKIIEKIRLIAKYNPDIKDVVTNNASIELEESDENKIELKSIEFSYYDSLIATDTKLVFYPDGSCGNQKTIVEYKSWNELISL